MKESGSCIFCGEKGMTKQHIWPNFLRKIVQFKNNAVNTKTTIHYTDKFVSVTPSYKKQQGDMLTKKIRRVCRACNNGWMSVLESQIKEVVSGLINEETLELENNLQSQLSAWITLVVVMAEFLDEHTKSVPTKDLLYLMKNIKTPQGWKIFIGRYEGIKFSRKYTHNGKYLCKKDDLANFTGTPSGNCQDSMFIIDSLFIYARSIPTDLNFTPRIDNFLPKLSVYQLWPIASEKLIFPIKKPLLDYDIDNILSILTSSDRKI
ncbi:MAG: hypothetical protein AB8B74_10685 [Crocinitomicaceae bacterium]